MKIPFVDLNLQYKSIKVEIDTAIQDVITKSAFIKGEYVEQFERNFEKKYGVKHCISCANGTDALFIALKMLGIGNGDEVITTSLSWISTSESISLTGARPVFIDIDSDYFTIDASKIENKITDKTKAIIPVQIYGQCADMDPVLKLAKKYNLYVIEDTAQAHFAQYKGRFAGTMGYVGTFSFYPGKNLGAYGDAGAIITNNDELAERMRMFANHGALKKHSHLMEGMNSRLDGLQAAVLSVKLKYIEQWTEQRRKAAAIYSNLLSTTKGVITPKERTDNNHVFHIYCIKTKYRDKLKDALQRENIPTGIHYPTSLPLLDAYKRFGYKEDDFPIAFNTQKSILSLPIYPEITVEQIEYIVDSITRIVK